MSLPIKCQPSEIPRTQLKRMPECSLTGVVCVTITGERILTFGISGHLENLGKSVVSRELPEQ